MTLLTVSLPAGKHTLLLENPQFQLSKKLEVTLSCGIGLLLPASNWASRWT